ncbi:hypothetical protein V1511DRAFT_499206 [Dipodascopsis uninucleata]
MSTIAVLPINYKMLPEHLKKNVQEKASVAWNRVRQSTEQARSSVKTGHVRLVAEVLLAVYVVVLLFQLRYISKADSISADSRSATEVLTLGLLSSSKGESDYVSVHAKVDRPIDVFVVNTVNYHFEVFVPVVETFSAIENVNTTVLSSEEGMSKWGIRNAMEMEAGGAGVPLIDVTAAGNSLTELAERAGKVPDFVFLTTCPEDMRTLGKGLHDILTAGTHIMCIVHEAHLWDYRNIEQYENEIAFMRPWVERGQWHFATLSRHVHTFVRSNFPKFLEMPDRDFRPLLFHPVFDFSVPANPDFSAMPFAIIPGKFETERRNYQAIFDQYNLLNCDIALRLVGSGKIPDVQEHLNPKIGFITNLNFFEFFSEMSKGVAIIPTLGNEHYLKSQSSSTVATSIIAGTPLIASQQFLYAHSQIPVDAVWVQGDGESELEVLARVGKLGPTAWAEKKLRVTQLRSQLIRENVARATKVLNIISQYTKSLKNVSS